MEQGIHPDVLFNQNRSRVWLGNHFLQDEESRERAMHRLRWTVAFASVSHIYVSSIIIIMS